VIFGGLDWDISIYGAPYSNTTGIISIDLIEQLIVHLKSYAKGNRIAWIGFKSLTSEKITKAYKNILQLDLDYYFVKSFPEWQKQIINLQKKYDILILNGSLSNMKDWDQEAAKELIKNEIAIPIGTLSENFLDISLIGLYRFGYEVGNWVGNTTLKVLKGEKIKDIPVTYTKEGELYLNLNLGEILDIEFDPQLLKTSKTFEDMK
jgi:ABC-type uncharacterized transport system substrate-binding protein